MLAPPIDRSKAHIALNLTEMTEEGHREFDRLFQALYI